MTVCGGGSVAAYRVHGPVVRIILGRMQSREQLEPAARAQWALIVPEDYF